MEMYKGQPVRVATLQVKDTTNPIFRIKWKDKGKDAENPNNFCRLTIDANGSGGSKLIVFLDIGASSASYNQYQFSAYATGVSDPNSVDSTPTHTQCTTVKALINALNAIDGIVAHRLHAPADYSIDTDDFIDGTATMLRPYFTEHLYRDVSELDTFSARLGVPMDVNGKIGRGEVCIVRILAYCNNVGNSNTAVSMTVSYDPNETDESEEVELGYTKLIPDATLTEMYDFWENPPVHKGPLLVEMTSTAGAGDLVGDANARIIVHYISREI